MAIVGGAIVPLLQGLLADNVGVHPSFVVPMVCYAYLIWYAVRGSQRASVSV
jgi:FHS family L-fucose permease-like MFS transporter